MIVLSIDTSSKYTAVALLDENTVLAEYRQLAKNHSGSLLPSIESLFDEAGLSLEDIGLIAISIGPGSFTGVRIGLAAAKTLAFSRKLPLVGVSSLHALACNALDSEQTAVICPALDALKNEVYCAIYSVDEHDLMELQAPGAMDPVSWASQLYEKFDRVLVLGSGLEKYAQLFHNQLESKLLLPKSPSQNVISAVVLGRLAIRKLKNSGGDDPGLLEPLYCRLSGAELKRA